MLLISVEVSVKVACRSTTATDWRHRAISMLLILVEVSVKVACQFTTFTDISTRISSMEVVRWYSGPTSHFHGHFHQNKYHGRIMDVALWLQSMAVEDWQVQSGLSVSESINEIGFSVMTGSDYSNRVKYLLLILVEVSVKVACKSTTATDCRHRAISMLLILMKVSATYCSHTGVELCSCSLLM